MKLKIGQATIEIERGDITDYGVDALVNAANTTLVMGAGVAGALKRKGGAIIEEEATQQAPIEVGEAVITTGGNLIATHVIHAAVMGPDLKTDAGIIATATKAVLVLADKHRLTSVAMPAFGTGVGHIAPSISADAMLTAVAEYLRSTKSTVKRVRFVLYLDEAHKAFTETLKRLGGS